VLGIQPAEPASRGSPPPLARATARRRAHTWPYADPPIKWPRRPAVGRGIECWEFSPRNQRRAALHRLLRAPRRDAVPTLGPMPTPPKSGHGVPPWGGESSPRNPARGIKLGESSPRNQRRAALPRLLRAPRRDAVPTLGGTPSLAPRPERKRRIKKSGHGVPPWGGESSAGNPARGIELGESSSGNQRRAALHRLFPAPRRDAVPTLGPMPTPQ
jgi:hypothetical protein